VSGGSTDIQRLIRELKRRGWVMLSVNSGHHTLRSPGGHRVVLPGSPSPHGLKDTLARIRKIERSELTNGQP
jgi:predicted RNA binding protein YcfA (HicA-like mRNA interferase family)